MCFIKDGKETCCAYGVKDNAITGKECIKLDDPALDRCNQMPGSRAITCGKDGKIQCYKHTIVRDKDGKIIPGKAEPAPCPTNSGVKNGDRCDPNGPIKTNITLAMGDAPAGGAIAAAGTSTGTGWTISVPDTEMVCSEATAE
jgi:hypothetical protein